MSEARRKEITRKLDQMRDALTYAREVAGRDAAISEQNGDYNNVLHATSFIAAFVDLLGGIAVDLNAIREKLEDRDDA